jgi:hypothetical protein
MFTKAFCFPPVYYFDKLVIFVRILSWCALFSCKGHRLKCWSCLVFDHKISISRWLLRCLWCIYYVYSRKMSFEKKYIHFATFWKSNWSVCFLFESPIGVFAFFLLLISTALLILIMKLLQQRDMLKSWCSLVHSNDLPLRKTGHGSISFWFVSMQHVTEFSN